MTDDDLTPEFEQAFTEFDDAVDAVADELIESRLAQTLGRIPTPEPSWASHGIDAYLDVALQRGQEILDQALGQAREIVAQAKQRALELIADAGNQYTTDCLSTLWPDDGIWSVRFAEEWISRSGPSEGAFVDEIVRQIDDAGSTQAGKVSRDEVVQILKAQMFGACRRATVMPKGPSDPKA
jgi:hypothetical protein